MASQRAVVSGFVHRIYRSCSNWKNVHESLERAKGILKRNSKSTFIEYLKERHYPLCRLLRTQNIEQTYSYVRTIYHRLFLR